MPDVTRFFHPVLSSRRLRRKPVRVELAGRAYVLFRGAQGRPAALADACPHRFTPLSAGRVTREGRLECPYHGWLFDADGRGRSPSQPELKKCDARAFQLLERHGYLWLAARDVPLSAFPDFIPQGFEFNGAFSLLFRAPLHVTLDNFSEDEHTPFVHTRLGWDRGQAGQIEYEAHNLEDRTEVRYRAPQRLSPLVRRAALALSWYEVRDDARFIPLVADTPYSLQGMRLGRYDKPLIHHRKLLERLYFGPGSAEASPASRPPPEAASG